VPPKRKLSGPCIIVGPTSLVFTWAEASRKFTPELKIVP